MATIKVGKVETKELDILPEGKYEVFVDKFDEVVTADGVESSRIMFTVRTDIPSNFKNRKIFTNIRSSWGWMVNGISKALGIPVDSDYETLTDFLNDIKGKPLVVKVRHKPNPKDATKPYVNVTDFFPTTKAAIKTETDDSII